MSTEELLPQIWINKPENCAPPAAANLTEHAVAATKRAIMLIVNDSCQALRYDTKQVNGLVVETVDVSLALYFPHYSLQPFTFLLLQ